MAVQAIIVADPKKTIKTLTPLTKDADENFCGFASEATRTRGVWAASIPILMQEPSLGPAILNPLSRFHLLILAV
jgi:3-methyladenine DNA glycosylase AlkC